MADRNVRIVIHATISDEAPEDGDASCLFIDWLCEAEEAWQAPRWVGSFDGCDIEDEPE